MRTALIAVFLLAAGCGQPPDPTAAASTERVQTSASPAPAQPRPQSQAQLPQLLQASAALPDRLDCLRKSGGVLVIGHRGGPTRDFPENAIETLERTLKAGTRADEIDIAQTKDNWLVLMHDDSLDRTTNGKGLVSDYTWEQIAKLDLRTYSKATKFHPPTLYETLTWAVENNVLLELDKKKSASWDPVIEQVRAAKAENTVFLITYTDDEAVEVHQKAPDVVLTAEVNSADQLDRLLARGVKADHLVAWTGTEAPNPNLWKALAALGVESAFGTLGPKDKSLDGKYWQDGRGDEYSALASGGLSILVTGLTDKVSRQLSESQAKARACGF